MKTLILPAFLVLLMTNVFSQNILIGNKNGDNEPSIMMDPNHPNFLVAAANLNNYYVSTDTGRTWQGGILESSHGVWGDPTIVVDTAGSFYFFHLSNPASGNWIDRIVCQKTTDHATSWSDGSYAGLNGTKAQDKQWCAIDRHNNNMYLTWTQFDEYGSTVPEDSSVILFSKSTDAGQTWSEAKRISKHAGDCIDSDQTVEGAVPAVGPNGEVYVAWAGPNGIVFNRSTDAGENWLSEEIKVDDMPTGWDYAISGIYRANGLPVTACDTSNSAYRGTIYINWTDQRNGADNTEVWLSKSTDGGDIWSAPIRVNDDTTNRQQFFTWMTIDQTNGYLYFVFYDRRNYTSDSTDVYLALSKDGGSTFINKKISESPFVPNSGIFFGDYTNITAHHGIIRPIWARLNKRGISVWTDLTREEDFTTAVEEKTISKAVFDFENYPNPSSDYVDVSYKLHTLSSVSLGIYNINGQLIEQVMNKVEKGYGKYIETIELNALNIKPGTYFLTLQIDGKVKTKRQIVIR